MTPSLLTLPVRVGLRGAQLGLQITAAVTDRALGVVGAVADATSRAGDSGPELDLDGQPFGGMPAPAPDPVPPPPVRDPAPPATPPVPEPLPAPHLSTEADLVRSVAEPGAEDGAGATVHVEEPWPGYDKLRAADIVERISAADVAQLGAIELYERNGRRRRTVLDAVARALRDASAQ